MRPLQLLEKETTGHLVGKLPKEAVQAAGTALCAK